jgi:hypothetical protein
LACSSCGLQQHATAECWKSDKPLILAGF